MAITEFVLPKLRQDAESRAAFSSIIVPFLGNLLDEASGLKQRLFGKVLVENGIDVRADFRPCIGAEYEKAENFYTLVAGEGFRLFGPVVKPYALAPPNPQLYETDMGPSEVFGKALTEVWQVKLENGNQEEVGRAWKGFVAAVGGVSSVKSIQGISLNQEEKLFLGVLGWESLDAREKVLETSAAGGAKKILDGLVWNTFLVTFAQETGKEQI